jgi:hypothetical protein
VEVWLGTTIDSFVGDLNRAKIDDAHNHNNNNNNNNNSETRRAQLTTK